MISNHLPDALDALFRPAVDAGHIPGVVMGVASSDRVLYQGAFGKKSSDGMAELELDAVFIIASMTKPITGVAVMQLVEAGVVDLDEPLGRFIPYLESIQVLEGFDEQNRPQLRAPSSAVTLRHLLTHTSGFVYEMWNGDIRKFQEITGHPKMPSGKLEALRVPLMFDPGTRWEYGVGIDWAGLVLEAVTGTTLSDYMQQNILSPLEMNDTTYTPTPDIEQRLVPVHQRLAGQEFKVSQLRPDLSREYYGGGAGLYSTISDYLRFCRMILNQGELDGNRILSPETVGLMSRNAMGPNRVQPLPSFDAVISNDAEFFPGIEKTWGLTFLINEEATFTGRSRESLSWGGIFNTFFWIDHSRDSAGVFLTQISPWVDKVALPLFESFESVVNEVEP